MFISYPACFYYSRAEEVPFFVTFPDFPNSATQGNDITDALVMASDWLGLRVADDLVENRNIPAPSAINELSLVKNDPNSEVGEFDPKRSFISMVLVNLDEYLNEATLTDGITLPKPANEDQQDGLA
ncbi:type II toxin-antitoxin system HicB family antitoxin [Lactiplantibacillus fabifermentans]|uniref:HicB-like antitoxin of toxin-antitoxin system domain-containing protein n=2 Tax=Lactiplantibacillus fabifermentans TaxID=483011 RepID=A0A0R2N8N2_9LACO|nr:type II toxin-antitoxin system HicB family antitoxin [Lactiplantibacillus fabifermentans]ETY73211.1 hypothetical protein LFAB_13105 [Lactiplantibacillus fabifermentans T30PCM01]KRO22190.1 hypothetical protein DY78_GL002258 [Lactiplantibacillus fabifermentans DSM 21115]